MSQLNWSEDRVEQLKTLWTEGAFREPDRPCPGRGHPPMAVIGQGLHRLGLAGRASPSRSEAAGGCPMAPKAAQHAQPCAARPGSWRKIP